MDPNKLAGGWAAGVVEPPKEKAGGFWSAVVPADEDEFPNEKDGAVDELMPEDPAFCCPVFCVPKENVGLFAVPRKLLAAQHIYALCADEPKENELPVPPNDMLYSTGIVLRPPCTLR